MFVAHTDDNRALDIGDTLLPIHLSTKHLTVSGLPPGLVYRRRESFSASSLLGSCHMVTIRDGFTAA